MIEMYNANEEIKLLQTEQNHEKYSDGGGEEKR